MLTSLASLAGRRGIVSLGSTPWRMTSFKYTPLAFRSCVLPVVANVRLFLSLFHPSPRPGPDWPMPKNEDARIHEAIRDGPSGAEETGGARMGVGCLKGWNDWARNSGGKREEALERKFESEHGSEEDLTYLQWVQASENYIRFFESCGESGVAQATRWKNHFDFLRRRVDTIEDFPAVKALDIRFRKDYVPKPFAFSIALYNWELEKTIQSIQLQNLKAHAENVRRNKKFNRNNLLYSKMLREL
ncbi:hypothetical protein F5887DRAFT_1160243 [Amanita rubescens]|nr:hypothetical protein F5887DRAFT_1160243 [Amanita rubescens]